MLTPSALTIAIRDGLLTAFPRSTQNDLTYGGGSEVLITANLLFLLMQSVSTNPTITYNEQLATTHT